MAAVAEAEPPGPTSASDLAPPVVGAEETSGATAKEAWATPAEGEEREGAAKEAGAGGWKDERGELQQ